MKKLIALCSLVTISSTAFGASPAKFCAAEALKDAGDGSSVSFVGYNQNPENLKYGLNQLMETYKLSSNKNSERFACVTYYIVADSKECKIQHFGGCRE